MGGRRHGTILPRLVAVVALKAVVVAVVVLYRRMKGKNEREYRALLAKVPPKSITDFEKAAMEKLGALAKVYLQYFSDQAVTISACRAFFHSIRLLPTILTGDLSHVDTTLSIFGQTLDVPVLIAPTAFHSLMTPEGEIATARGAGAAGVGYCYNWMLSSKLYTHVLSEPGVKWLHLYMFEERDLVKAALERAQETGKFSAIILTCDHPHRRVQGRMVPYFRQADFPNSTRNEPFFPNQAVLGFDPTTIDDLTKGKLGPRAPGGTNSPKLSWEDVKWIQSLTSLPIVAKGILSAHDAKKALEVGVDAIVVSNHGGRQCDFAPPAIEALPTVVAAVKGKIPIFVDTGVRSSGDILRALCLGATGVLLGRPPLWALACEGSDGLARMMNFLQQDLQDDMRSLGVKSISELSLAHLWPPDRERILHAVQACGEDLAA